MSHVTSLYRSTIARKILMAVTGFILIGFLIGHMIGNLKAFEGAARLNGYAEFLRTVGYPALGRGEFLWIFRLVLLASVGLHLWAAITLTLRNRAARPTGYRKWVAEDSTYASRTMIWGGIIIALYIVYHILHFTTSQAHGDFQPGDVYHNVVFAFSRWPVVLAYVVAQLALGLHLYHGFWSALRTLGAANPRFEACRRGTAVLLAAAITLGFISVPLAVLAGIIS